MWLLDTKELTLHNFLSNVPDYAILSHTWGREEVTFEQIHDKEMDPQIKGTRGYRKIAGCCKQAMEDGIAWIWIDTCCIDKRSSAELSEAINSMYKWYWNAVICYAFLEDMIAREFLTFVRSRWFKRGWTLQELLAPDVVEFYNGSWDFVGSKMGLVDKIYEATRIDPQYIRDRSTLQDASIATKFSWASERTTTRVEDVAYSLLGLVQVNMPMLYGEGDKAFYRLQQELLRKGSDHTIFAWETRDQGLSPTSDLDGFLAPSPLHFQLCAGYTPVKSLRTSHDSTQEVTNQGLRITLPYSDSKHGESVWRTICLACKDNSGNYVGLLLKPPEDGSQNNYIRVNSVHLRHESAPERWRSKTLYLKLESTRVSKPSARTSDITMRGIFTSGEYLVNGFSLSTQSGIEVLRAPLDLSNPRNKSRRFDQHRLALEFFSVPEHQVGCVCMAPQNEDWPTIALVFGVYQGQPLLLHSVDTQGPLSTDWFKALELHSSGREQYIRDHILDIRDDVVIDVWAKKTRGNNKFRWMLTIKVYKYTCKRPGLHRVATDCDCYFYPVQAVKETKLPSEPNSRSSTPEQRQVSPKSSQDSLAHVELPLPKSRKRRRRKPNARLYRNIQDLAIDAQHASLNIHGAVSNVQNEADETETPHFQECTCHACVRESKIEVCGFNLPHLLECICSACRKESKILTRPLYCNDDTCGKCETGRRLAASVLPVKPVLPIKTVKPPEKPRCPRHLLKGTPWIDDAVALLLGTQPAEAAESPQENLQETMTLNSNDIWILWKKRGRPDWMKECQEIMDEVDIGALLVPEKTQEQRGREQAGQGDDFLRPTIDPSYIRIQAEYKAYRKRETTLFEVLLRRSGFPPASEGLRPIERDAPERMRITNEEGVHFLECACNDCMTESKIERHIPLLEDVASSIRESSQTDTNQAKPHRALSRKDIGAFALRLFSGRSN